MKCWPTGEKGAESMTVVCLLILAGIFWGDFLLKNYIEKHVGEWEEREICRGRLLIRKHHNKGMMLNAGQKRRRLVAAVSLAFTLILTVIFIVSLGHRVVLLQIHDCKKRVLCGTQQLHNDLV